MSVRATAVALLLVVPLSGCARENPLFGGGGDDGTGSGSTAGDDGRPTQGADADSNSDSQGGSNDASDSTADTGSGSDSNGETGRDGCLPNFECLPLPGGPWQGPVTYSTVGLTEDPGCLPGPYGRLEHTASIGPLPPEEVPCCECEALEAVCDDPIRVFSNVMGCGVEIPSGYEDGTVCMPNAQIDAGFMDAPVQVLEPAECSVTGAAAGDFDGLTKARLCASDAPRSPCPGGQCVPDPGVDRLCVYADSDLPCPDGWSVRHELFTPTTEDCGGCECNVPAGTGCDAVITRYTEPDCAGGESTGFYVGCNQTADILDFASHVFEGVAGGFSCQAIPGPMVTSPVTRQDVWSVCCLE